MRNNTEERDIIIKTLALRIKELEKRVEWFCEHDVDRLYSRARDRYSKALIAALKTHYVSMDKYEPNAGDLVATQSGIYLLSSMRADRSEYYSYAWLTDFFCDAEHNFEMNIELRGDLSFDYGDYLRPASDQEVILFDYMLKQKGYERLSNGRIRQLTNGTK